MTMRSDVADALQRVESTDGVVRAWFRFAPSLPLFAGHFPGRPLLPAVLQVEMVRQAVEAATETSWRIAAVVNARFRAPALPDVELLVDAAFTSEGRVRAKIHASGQSIADISLRLTPAD